jgi:hypothetical protein
LHFHERALDDTQAIETIRELAARANALTTVFVCLDNESQSLAFGLAAQTALRGMGVPVFVRMRSTTGLASVLGGVPDLGAFGALEQVCDWTALDTGHLDRLAKEVHALYLSKRSRDGGGSHPDWKDLDPVLQDSCRQQADHVGAKLRATHCAAEPGSDGSFAFSPDEIETLARMEHRRWVAERILNGWRPGPRDETRRTTPYLVDYNDLTEDIKDYDRDTVRNLPKLLAMSGHRVRRLG